jgi:hypothetical protein
MDQLEIQIMVLLVDCMEAVVVVLMVMLVQSLVAEMGHKEL